MGIFDRLLGKDDARAQGPAGPPSGQSADQQAIARYNYMLKTAPPETIEEAHTEAFSRLTPEQRRMVLEQLRGQVPEAERLAAERGDDDPQALARLATRAELRQPGTMERTFGRGGVGLGGLMAGGFLSTIAGTVVGSMIAQQFFTHHGGSDAPMTDHAQDAGTDASESNDDYTADDGGGDMDIGGDVDAGGSWDV